MFGFGCQQKLMKPINIEREKIKENFANFLQTAISYMEKIFDFSNKRLSAILVKLNFNKNYFPVFQNFMECVEVLKLNHVININNLFDEFCIIKDNIFNNKS